MKAYMHRDTRIHAPASNVLILLQLGWTVRGLSARERMAGVLQLAWKIVAPTTMDRQDTEAQLINHRTLMPNTDSKNHLRMSPTVHHFHHSRHSSLARIHRNRPIETFAVTTSILECRISLLMTVPQSRSVALIPGLVNTSAAGAEQASFCSVI